MAAAAVLLAALGCASAPRGLRGASRLASPRASPRLTSTVEAASAAPTDGGAAAFDAEAFDSVVMKTYSRVPIAIERGEGCYLWDSTGKRYLDFAAGIATACLGHAHPALIEAVSPQGQLAQMLTERSPTDKVRAPPPRRPARPCAEPRARPPARLPPPHRSSSATRAPRRTRRRSSWRASTRAPRAASPSPSSSPPRNPSTAARSRRSRRPARPSTRSHSSPCPCAPRGARGRRG